MKAIRRFFEKNFPAAYSLMPDLISDFKTNATSSLVTMKCYPWVKRNVTIGDAAHAIVPFYGQGMNAGFEDCRDIEPITQLNSITIAKGNSRIQQQRKPDTDAIAGLALDNFVEMRDLVADPEFLLRKKIEAKIHQLYPDRWIPFIPWSPFTMRFAIRRP